MGVLYDYFAAASDDAAASTISILGGPARASAGQSAGTGRTPFDTVAVGGIDPVVQMGTLEALLTGGDFEQILEGPRAGKVLAAEDGGELVVVALTDELQAALAGSDEAALEAVAVPWSQTEEFWGEGDPQILASVLGELAGLARRARQKDQRLYCWISV